MSGWVACVMVMVVAMGHQSVGYSEGKLACPVQTLTMRSVSSALAVERAYVGLFNILVPR